MPWYEWRCPEGCTISSYLTVSSFETTTQICQEHGQFMSTVIGSPAAVKVAPDLCYDSPVDGRPITSHQARANDLARNGCIPYDPEMQKDVARRHQERQAEIEQGIDEYVDARIAKMSTAERGKLWNEITRQGADLEYSRSTKES